MLGKLRKALPYLSIGAAGLTWAVFLAAAGTPNNVLIQQGTDMACIMLDGFIVSLFASLVGFMSDSSNRALKFWALAAGLSFPLFLIVGVALLFVMAMTFGLSA